MESAAVVLREPEQIALMAVALDAPGPADVVVDIDWSGISTGTEKLLWSGRMPAFPGMAERFTPTQIREQFKMEQEEARGGAQANQNQPSATRDANRNLLRPRAGATATPR